ncbi:MAG: hypothetical protein AVDCRST_MAG26-1908, partial [uncultured Chloroflexia bacterium]
CARAGHRGARHAARGGRLRVGIARRERSRQTGSIATCEQAALVSACRHVHRGNNAASATVLDRSGLEASPTHGTI